jgi:hypothetical protein
VLLCWGFSYVLDYHREAMSTQTSRWVAVLFAVSIPAVAQKPEIFDLSDVAIGTRRINTRWLYTAGKWSDAGQHSGAPFNPNSVLQKPELL